MSITNLPELTARQARFAQEYAIDGNGTAAAVRAGFAPRGAHVEASRLLRNPKVAAAIKTRQEAVSERLAITQERVVEMLLQAYEQAKQMQEPAAMVSAAREIGRLLGHYEPAKVRLAVDVATEVERGKLAALSDQELFSLIAQGEAAMGT